MTTAADPLSIAEMQALAQSPASAAQQLRSLLVTLEDPDEERRAWANDCLQEIVEPLSADWDILSARCMQEYEVVASWACKLLGRTGQPEFQKILAHTLLHHGSKAVCQQAALALEHLGALTEESRSALTVAAQSTDSRLKRLAQQALDKN